MEFRPRSCCHPLACKSKMDWTFRGVRPRSCRLTSLACKSETEVGLWPFDPVRTTATSLAYNSESKVGFHGPSIPFAFLPPPSQARARRRWVLCQFDPVRATATSLACNNETEVSFMSFQPFRIVTTSLACKNETEVDSSRPRSRRRHLPPMQGRVRGGFLGGLDPVHAAVTSPTYNGESDVGFYGPSTLFAPLLPPRMQQRVGGDLYGLSTRSGCRHLPRMQQQSGP